MLSYGQFYGPGTYNEQRLPAEPRVQIDRAAERTVEGLWTTIGECLPAFSPNECKNYFAAAGYDAT